MLAEAKLVTEYHITCEAMPGIGYQKAAEEIERAMLPVIPMKPATDKRSRLQVVAPYIKNGTVLFPRAGCEQLLGQVFNLGVDPMTTCATRWSGSFRGW